MTRAHSLESRGHFSLLQVTSLFWKINKQINKDIAYKLQPWFSFLQLRKQNVSLAICSLASEVFVIKNTLCS